MILAVTGDPAICTQASFTRLVNRKDSGLPCFLSACLCFATSEALVILGGGLSEVMDKHIHRYTSAQVYAYS